MKKILFLLLIPFILLANTHIPIDERVTDIYFANGIMNSKKDARASLKLIEDEVLLKLYSGDKLEMEKHHNFDTAYNESYGMGLDLFESFLQVIAQSPTATSLWSAFKTYVGSKTKIDFIDLIETWTTKAKNKDLTTQITSYTNSIEAGHGVIVVAHSQGNLFTNEAYAKLAPWMQSYFNMINVASPTSTVAGGGDIISWGNDAVGQIAQGNINYIPNPIRQVEWIDLGGKVSRYPYSDYIYDNQVGSTYDNRFKSEENLLNKLDTNVHAFPYYMGEPLKYDGKGEIPHGMTNDTPLTTDKAKIKISARMLSAVSSHKTAPSQWKKEKEFGCNCEEKYITVKHKYDSSLNFMMKDKKVLPFDKNAKLYPIDGKYVKAPFPGEKIKENKTIDICFDLLDFNDSVISQMSGSDMSFKAPSGLFTAQLNWDEAAVKLKIANSLMSEESSGCGVTAIGSGDLTLYDVYPGSYAIGASAEGYEDLDGNISDTISLNIRAVGASKSDKFRVTNKYQYANLGKSGHIADIFIKRPEPTKPPEIEVVPISASYVSGGIGIGIGKYSAPHYTFESDTLTEVKVPPMCSDDDESCGCLPCQYSILTYLNQSKLGPISGATVKYNAPKNQDNFSKYLIS